MTAASALHVPGRGIAFILAAMFCISVNDMLIKSLSGGYPLHQIVLIRSIIGVAISFLFLSFEGGLAALRTGAPGLHGLRALLVVFANSAFYAALVAMPLATANALYFVAPLFVTLLSIPVLGERVGPRRLLAVLAGFGGVLVMLAPQFAGTGDGPGWLAVLPMLAAAGYAAMSVLTRKLGQASPASALAIYLQSAFIVVSLVVFAVAGDGRFAALVESESLRFLLRPWVVPAPQDFLPLGGLGVLSGLIGYSISQAYRSADASLIAPFEYVLLVFALGWGWAVFGEWPQPAVFAGAAIIIAAGIYLALRERRERRAAALAARRAP